MRSRLAIAAITATVLLLAACTAQKEYAYLKDVPRGEALPISQSYKPTLATGDRLAIMVYSQTPEATIALNSSNAAIHKRYSEKNLSKGYLVGSDGKIVLPQLGEMQAAGLTTDSLARVIASRLVEAGIVRDAKVAVAINNFTVVVVGEVATPNEVHSPGQRLTILEALAACGDGVPSNTVVVRTTEQGRTIDTVDLTSRTLLDSPYYYLRQNDIVFVPPTEKKRKKAYRDEDWPTYMNLGLQSVRFAYTTIYRWFFQPNVRRALNESNR